MLFLCFSVKSQWCIEIRQDGLVDVRGVSGSKVELVCEVSDLRYSIVPGIKAISVLKLRLYFVVTLEI